MTYLVLITDTATGASWYLSLFGKLVQKEQAFVLSTRDLAVQMANACNQKLVGAIASVEEVAAENETIPFGPCHGKIVVRDGMFVPKFFDETGACIHEGKPKFDRFPAFVELESAAKEYGRRQVRTLAGVA